MKRWLPVILVLLFIALSIASSNSESMTFDEIVHQEEGVNALTKHTFLVDTNNPPFVRELLMLPTVAGAGRLLPPRVVSILIGTLTLVAVYLVTKRYFGNTQALFALFLLSLEPTFLANSHYITLDTGASFLFFIGYMTFIRLMEQYSLRRLVTTSVLWGTAFSSKMTVVPFMLAGSIIAGYSIFKHAFRKFLKRTIHGILFVCICACVIWATYFFSFDVIIAPRNDPDRFSSKLHTYAAFHNNKIIESFLSFGETRKIPLGNYLAVIKNTLMWPGTKSDIFFLGNFYPAARWYFMPVTVLLKLPIPLITFFCIGLFTRTHRRRIAIFGIPVLTILGVTSFVNNQPWIRYFLPAIPFVVIVASSAIRWISGTKRTILFLVFCLWYAAGAGMSFPHFISYANELAGLQDQRYRMFMDSNLDWGQGLPDIARYISIIRPGFVSFSYFGRDNGDAYGLTSDVSYGSHRYEDICAFHHINLPYQSTKIIVAISVSNWYYCKYNIDPRFSHRPIQAVVGQSILIL